MAKGEDITTRYKLDISDLKKKISEANNYIKLANSEFKKLDKVYRWFKCKVETIKIYDGSTS